MTPSSAMTRWRIALVGLGVLLLLVALSQLVVEVPPTRWLGIVAWLLGALVLHDGILALAVVGASVLLRRLKLPIPFAVVLIVQGAVVVGAIVTLLVLPEIIKRAIGTANPSILPLDYLGNLVLFWVGIAVTTVIVTAGYLLVRMLRARRSRTT